MQFDSRPNRNANMGKRGAVRFNSGLPVDHSGPGLGVGPGTPTTSGRNPEACPPSQHKSGREPEGGALGGGAAAVVSRLDHISSNRNKRSGRSRNCGAFTVRTKPAPGTDTHYHRVNCKTWGCEYCAPRKAKRYKHSIRVNAERHELQRFLTLTLDPKKVEGDPVRYLRRAFDKLRTYLRRKYGAAPTYICVLEFQANGNPHLHILIDRYVEKAWIAQAWAAVGGGFVDIRYVDLHRVSRYLAKYLTIDLMLSAPRGYRRVTCSRNIRLVEKTANSERWEFLRVPISTLYSRLFVLVKSLHYDEDNALSGFIVSNSIEKGNSYDH